MDRFKKHLQTGSNHLGITVSDDQADLMLSHANELIKWNKKINLTAIKDPLLMAEKHFIDSIASMSFFNTEKSLMDLGSGGGFPGIPIKIMNPDIHVVLVDASRKKVNFLKHVIRSLPLNNIDAIHSRVEDLQHDKIYAHKFDAVISRAFTDLSGFVALASPFLSQNGSIYAMKGKQGEKEILPSVLNTFNIKTDRYELPFEKSLRYMIRLSKKS